MRHFSSPLFAQRDIQTVGKERYDNANHDDIIKGDTCDNLLDAQESHVAGWFSCQRSFESEGPLARPMICRLRRMKIER